MTLQPGEGFGRYQILALLGQGGMASVYKALQPSLRRTVALKVMRPALAADPEFLERFRREAEAIARLAHPHVVQVYDFDEVAGRPVLVMQYLEGGTLKEKLGALAERGARLPPEASSRLVGEVAAALGYAHQRDIVHRDIKPANIMLDAEGRAVVTDFGIAKILGATQYTQTGVGIGTPEYMSPEQGQGLAVDHRSDLYSLGVVAYELLTGRVPFTADTPMAVIFAHIRDPLPLPSRLDPAIGRATEQVLVRALAKDPAARHQDASEFARALERAIAADERATPRTAVVHRRGPRPAPSSGISVPRRRLVLAGLAASLFALAGGAAVTGMLGRSQPATPPAPGAAETLPTGAPTPTRTPTPTLTPTPRPVEAHRVVATIKVGGSRSAFQSVAVDPTTNRVYVTTADSVSVIDGTNHAVVASVKVGDRPFAVAVNPTTNRVYVTNSQQFVSVIDGANHTVVASIKVGRSPLHVAVNPTTNRVYVANLGSNDVSVIDGASHAVVATIETDKPQDVTVNPRTNRVYVATADSISVIDGTNHAVVASVKVGGEAWAVAVNPTTNRAYVLNIGSNDVSVIDGASHAVVASVKVGGRGIAVNPTTNRVYVAQPPSNDLSVIDGASHAVVASVKLAGSFPGPVAVNPTTSRVYVTHPGSDIVSVIE